MLRQRWVAYLLLGGGCAITGIVTGALLAVGIYSATASLRAPSAESYAVSTKVAQDIPSNQPVNAAPTDGSIPLSTASAGTASAPLAALTSASGAAVARTPGAVNQAPTDSSASSSSSLSPIASAMATTTPDEPPQPIHRLRRAPTRQHTLPRRRARRR